MTELGLKMTCSVLNMTGLVLNMIGSVDDYDDESNGMAYMTVYIRALSNTFILPSAYLYEYPFKQK